MAHLGEAEAAIAVRRDRGLVGIARDLTRPFSALPLAALTPWLGSSSSPPRLLRPHRSSRA